METIIIQTEAKKAKAIKQFLKAFDVSFSSDSSEKSSKSEESPYNPEFVKEILTAREEEGGKIIDPNNLWESLK
ncbi:DUF2683 family protein [Flavobacterium sp. CS20]|uniref:DUF2683 family protein n=1 Tax=Flavobacterium sp. CS20 TaxID=2775246 RepID=UPI001B3A490A|nr:DUF2683 family protein [Flavobacterium sp. CS20]QTY26944.1 hypothetical protein IGB25_14005 [Flavobacterium sp. CS20]